MTFTPEFYRGLSHDSKKVIRQVELEMQSAHAKLDEYGAPRTLQPDDSSQDGCYLNLSNRIQLLVEMITEERAQPPATTP